MYILRIINKAKNAFYYHAHCLAWYGYENIGKGGGNSVSKIECAFFLICCEDDTILFASRALV